jgi:transcriptional regulator with XRE-family HTH domain
MTGDDIRRERESLGLTQAELARLLGVAMNTVSRWEIGERIPHPLVLKAVQSVLAEVKARAEAERGRKAKHETRNGRFV